MTANVYLALILAFLGLVFLVFWVLFAVRKERACGLIAGFNSLPKKRQAQYDRAAIARDYKRLFTGWTVGAFLLALACIWLGWWAFGAAMALLILSLIPHMHLWAENAFQKYKISD